MVFRLSSLIVPIVGYWALACLLGVLTALCVLGLLMVSGWFISMAAWSGLVMAGSHAFNYLAPSAMIRTFAIGRTAGRYGELLVAHQAVFSLLQQLRVQFFEAFAKLDNHQRQHLGSSTAQYRLVQDIDTLSEFVLRFVNPWVVALALGLVVASLFAYWVSAWLVLPILMAYVGIAWVSVGTRRLVEQVQAHQELRHVWLNQRLFATTQLLVWGRWQALGEQFFNIDSQLGQLLRRQQMISTGLRAWVQGCGMVLFVGVMIEASQNPKMTVPWLLALVFGVFVWTEWVAGLTNEPFAYTKSHLAQRSLNTLLSSPTTPKTKPPPADFDWHIQALSAKQPSAIFGLKNINAVIKQGTPLVITGVSGGGKSTLLDVMAGELVAQSGQMQLLGKAGECVAVEAVDWGDGLGYLGQRVDIFDKSLADNLRLAKPDASDDELYQVLSWVGLDGWVANQPAKLDTALGEYGTAVSGGQARRIALARLLLTPKKVLLLDEPFAGLDTATRQQLWQFLKQKQQHGILVVVSHHHDIIDETVDCLTIGEPSYC